VRVINLKGDDRIASVARVNVEPSAEAADDEYADSEDIAEDNENSLE
jgi:hypothetical protein